MKVKILDKWYDAEEVPIVIYLTEQDRLNIENMHPDARFYSMYPETWLDGDKDKIFDWIDEGFER